MSLLSRLRTIFGRIPPTPDADPDAPDDVPLIRSLTPGELYRTQPHLRAVVSFRARNVAQLPLPAYQRVSDTDRVRLGAGDDPVAALFALPAPGITLYQLMEHTVTDIDLYGVAIWAIAHTSDGWQVTPVPPAWVTARGGGEVTGRPHWIEVTNPHTGIRSVLHNRPGEAPAFTVFTEAPGWTSPVESLKNILAEQIQAWSYRRQVWQRGGRAGAYITRPADAPTWSPEARTQFIRDWESKWTGPNAPKAGGTPILEDGMELKRNSFSAREDEWAEVAKLSLATVAQVYHVSPPMIGLLDNANYANVREYHQMLYTDTLGPLLAMIQQRINTFIVPHLTNRPNVYVEFNIAAKLAGSFEEQAAVLSTSIGAPWMTTNEARARMNLPALPGGDDLVTPLNVLIGRQPSP